MVCFGATKQALLEAYRDFDNNSMKNFIRNRKTGSQSNVEESQGVYKYKIWKPERIGTPRSKTWKNRDNKNGDKDAKAVTFKDDKNDEMCQTCGDEECGIHHKGITNNKNSPFQRRD